MGIVNKATSEISIALKDKHNIEIVGLSYEDVELFKKKFEAIDKNNPESEFSYKHGSLSVSCLYSDILTLAVIRRPMLLEIEQLF